MNTKICTKCGIELNFEDFGKGNDKNDLSYTCLICDRKRTKKYQEENKDKVREASYKWKIKNIAKAKYYLIKSRASKRNIIFDMEIEEFVEWFNSQLKECIYCGDNTKLSVDRITPKQGYVINNLALACTKCNLIKSDILTFEEMKEIAEKYIKPKLNLKKCELEIV